MRVRLLGTGAPQGWPRPACTCASCRAALAHEVVRGPTSALVDGRLLLDPGAETGWAAVRHGVTLAGVELTLHSTAAPEAPAVLEGYEVQLVPSDGGVLIDLTGPVGRRLLWGCGPMTDAALDQVSGRAYDAVLLACASRPEQLAELRRRGAVTPATQVLALWLGHDSAPPAELDRLLAGWGARAPRDGDVIDVGAGADVPRTGRVLVLGGARSGKSAYAERRLAAEAAVTYIATAPPRDGDAEWAARIAAHRDRRPGGWTTVETGDLAGHLTAGPVLIDDLGLWLTRVLDEARAWDEGEIPAVAARCDALVAAWAACPGPAVLVAPEVGSGVIPATRSGRLFRDLLGALTARLAAASDEVVQVVAGLPRSLR